jgi:hypothetical protein
VRGSKAQGAEPLAVGLPARPARRKRRLLLAGLVIVAVAALAVAGMYCEGFFGQPG